MSGGGLWPEFRKHPHQELYVAGLVEVFELKKEQIAQLTNSLALRALGFPVEVSCAMSSGGHFKTDDYYHPLLPALLNSQSPSRPSPSMALPHFYRASLIQDTLCN